MPGRCAAASPPGTRSPVRSRRSTAREAAMKWITRERPKIDRVACPWLVARFIDRAPEFLFVPPGEVMARAKSDNAIPYDVPGVELTHVGERCSFDAFLAK